jgi:hypothetical protein
MTLTPEIKTQIENLATIIDYGMYGVHPLACIKHIEAEWDGRGIFLKQSSIDDQVFTLGCQAYFVIYKDILKYTPKQLTALTDNEFDMMKEIIDELKLQDDDVIYSKTALIQLIEQYIGGMVWDETFGTWHPVWK